MNPFKHYQVGWKTYRRGNPFLPFPFPRALFHIWVRGRLFYAFPLLPFQLFFWTHPEPEPGTSKFGPFYLSRKLR